jgi:ESCRT-II complex subunit VPS36
MGLGLQRIENIQKSKILYDSMLINNSFTGINTLRENAEKLISLAQQIRVKLNSKKNENNTNQILDINKILSKIGFIDPVTREVSGSDYYYELANQINEFFYNYFEKNKEIKVISLIDAYTIYNRARGTNTISPKDMRIAITYLTKKFNNKIFVKNFNNEIIVLHNKEYSTNNLISLIEKFMNENKQDYIDINDLSKIINVKNIILEKILIDDLLRNGNLLLDENDLEIKYYLNTILNYNI